MLVTPGAYKVNKTTFLVRFLGYEVAVNYSVQCTPVE